MGSAHLYIYLGEGARLLPHDHVQTLRRFSDGSVILSRGIYSRVPEEELDQFYTFHTS